MNSSASLHLFRLIFHTNKSHNNEVYYVESLQLRYYKESRKSTPFQLCVFHVKKSLQYYQIWLGAEIFVGMVIN